MSARAGAALASTIAGLAWIAAWVHLLLAHGVTEVNERKIVIGLTWLDSGRLIGPALVLAAAAVWLLASSSRHALLRRAAGAAVIGLSVAAAGAFLGFWTHPFGSYEGASREQGLAAMGGAVAIGGSVLMAAGVTLFAITAARAGVMPGWLAAVLVVGAVLAVPWLYESLQGVVFGIGLVALGAVLVTRRPDRSRSGRMA